MRFVASLVLAMVPLGATLVHGEYRYQYHADGGDTRYGDDECREYLQVNDISVSRETLECRLFLQNHGLFSDDGRHITFFFTILV